MQFIQFNVVSFWNYHMVESALFANIYKTIFSNINWDSVHTMDATAASAAAAENKNH